MEKCEGKTGDGKRPTIHKMVNVGRRKQRAKKPEGLLTNLY